MGGVKAPPGFSLLEALVATTILTVAVSALAGLSAMATRANDDAGAMSVATILAGQKMEQLRALAWGFDAAGAPVADTTTDTTVVPPRSSGGTGLSSSDGGALERNVPGYCDFLDAAGRSLGGGADAPSGAAYIRRWSIAPLPNADAVIVIQVRVMRARGRLVAGPLDRGPRSDEARLFGVKTRKAW